MDPKLEERFARAKAAYTPGVPAKRATPQQKAAAPKVNTTPTVPTKQKSGGDDPYNLQARFAKAKAACTPAAPKATAHITPTALTYQERQQTREATMTPAERERLGIEQQWYNAKDAVKRDQEEVDRLQREWETTRQQWVGLSRAGNAGDLQKATKERLDELDASLTAAKKAMQVAESDLAAWSGARYEMNAQRMQSALDEDKSAQKSYQSADVARADSIKLDKVINFYSGSALLSAEEIATIQGYEKELQAKYGLKPQDFVAAAQGEIPQSIQDASTKMEGAYQMNADELERKGPYDYRDMRGYAERVAAQEEREKVIEDTRQGADEHPVLTSVGTVLAQPLRLFDIVNVEPGRGKPGDPDYIPPYNRVGIGDVVDTTRGTVSQGIKNKVGDNWLGETASFLYQTGMSMADSYVGAKTLGTASVYLMGTNAGVSRTREIIDKGGTMDQAVWGGLASGVAEAMFEKVSIDRLLTPKGTTGWRSWVKETLKQGGVEASEEVCTEVANILSDVAIMGEKSEFNVAVKEYMAEGMTKEEAERKAYLDLVGQVVLAGAGGFISGMGMGGMERGAELVQYNRQSAALGRDFRSMGPEIADAILREGLDSDPSTDAYKLAEKLATLQADGKKISDKDLGKLYQANVAAIQAEGQSTAVDTDPATHTPEQQAVIREYQARTDESLKEVFQGYLDNPKQGFSRHNISDVSQRQAQDAQRLLGGTYEGYRNAINSNGIQHILGEHGPEGTVDQSLSDLNDIARMGYVLDHYDDVQVVTYESGDADLSSEFRDKNDRPAPMLKFSKRVDGTYYVVEAIPESKHQKFWVVSAYMKKAGGGTQAPDAQSPRTTPNASLASWPSANPSIPQAAMDVKTAEARVAQLEQQIAELDRQDVARGVAELGTQGQATVKAMFIEGQNAQSYVQGMRTLYEVGKAGMSMESVDSQAVRSLNDHQRRAAYEAGRIDAAGVQESQTLGKVDQRQGEDLPFYFGSEEGAVQDGQEGVRVREGGQRLDGAGAEVAAGGVAEGAGGFDAGADRGGPADPGTGAFQVGRAVSTKALGIADGLDIDSVRLVTGGESQDLRRAKTEAQSQGFELVAFTGGNLHVQVPTSDGGIVTVEARAYIAGNKVYVRADHAEVTGYQLWRHELYHNLVAQGKVSPERTMQGVRKQLGDELTDKLEAAYSRALGGITGVELWEEIAADQYGGINFFSGTVLEGEMEALGVLVGTQTDAQLNSQTTQATDSTTGPPQGGKMSQERRGQLTEAELLAVQSIGRKSVNELTSEELAVVEQFARRYYQELGEKSPFFRAWFGDWRANDQTPVQIAAQRGDARVTQVNEDTGWNIRVSGKVFSETTVHNNQANREARAYLPFINDIVKKAVLLDSYTIGKPKSPNSVMMHSLYAVADIGHGPEVLKLYVEEMNDPNQADTAKRAYQLQNIEISSLTGANTKGSGKALASFKTADIKSVADLFQAVKARDGAFAPREASKVVDAEGKPLVVYHGTDAEFTVFQSKDGAYWFGDEDYAAEMAHERGGERIVQAYLDMKNPYYATLTPGKFADPAFEGPIIQAAKEGGHDGVILSKDTDSDLEADTFYVVFEPTQIKSATDNIGTFDKRNPDIRFSQEPGGYVQELREQRTELEERGRAEGWGPERMEQEVRAAVQSALQSLVDEYGAMKPGEKRAREVQVPRKTGKHEKVSQTVRTILEAQATPEAAVPTIEELTAKGEFSYGPLSDKTAMERAERTIQNMGWGISLGEWFQTVKSGAVSKENTAMGWALYNQAANTGDIQTAMSIIQSMVLHQRNAAQAVQATRILKQMDPETQLYGVQRSVAGLQEELNRRFGEDKGPKLVISQELAEQLLAATDQEGRDRVMQEIYRDIGRQMPSSLADKWNAWRYLSMLGNVRTHVRNIVGNAGFAPVVAVKDMTATAIERAVSAVSGGRLERSKAMVGLGAKGRGLLAAAWGDYAKVQDAAMGGGKYSEFQNANRYIEDGRVIFKGKLGKPLEAARRANSKALDVEDMWFSKPHYAYAMAQYCAAQGITEETIRSGDAAALDKARAYAIKEAQKATYRDTNALSQLLGGLGRDMRRSDKKLVRGAGAMVEGVLPFRKTPANILARGVEYSPLGLLKGLSYDLAQVRQGKMSGAEAIDHISAGLTGTGLLALGAFLAAQGLLRGKGPGDDKEREMERLQGHQDYSLEIGDVSVTLDWLAPEVLPLFVGANLWETAQEDGEVTMSGILSAIGNVSDPFLEMSCLQSLNDIFDSVGYASQGDTSPLTSALVSAATSYLTQGLPTIFGQGERVFETQRESTFTSKDAFLTGDAQYFLGKVSGKVPGWEFQQIPYIDAWGRTEDTGGLGQRAFNNLLNPAYVSEIETSEMEEELVRLYEATGENVFPSRAKKYFQVKGERRDLDAEEYVDYATKKGQTARSVVEALVERKAYRALSDGEKAEAVADAYKYAEQTARKSVAKDYEPDSWVAKAQTAQNHGIPVEVYILLRAQCAGIESIKDKDGRTIDNSKGLQIMEAVYAAPGLKDSQRRQLFADFGVGKSIQHYNKALVTEKLRKMRR